MRCFHIYKKKKKNSNENRNWNWNETKSKIMLNNLFLPAPLLLFVKQLQQRLQQEVSLRVVSALNYLHNYLVSITIYLSIYLSSSSTIYKSNVTACQENNLYIVNIMRDVLCFFITS